MENRKIALVTGGSRGIGRAVCLALAKSGADVAVNYAGKEEAAQQTCRMCEELGARTLAIQADVADNAQVNAMVDQVIAQFGRLAILVCNAGITRDNLLMRMAEQDFDRSLIHILIDQLFKERREKLDVFKILRKKSQPPRRIEVPENLYTCLLYTSCGPAPVGRALLRPGFHDRQGVHLLYPCLLYTSRCV